MHRFKKTHRRLSLLTGASLIAAAMSATPVLMAPTTARAANECGDPNTNGASADTLTCVAGTYTSIIYPATNGNLTLRLQNILVTTGGIQVTPTGSNTVTISRTGDSPANSGDPQITNTSGAGISIIRDPAATGGNITINVSDNDFIDATMSVTGTTAGINLLNAGTGATTLTTDSGSITATAGYGVVMGTVGTGALTVTNAATVTGTSGSFLFSQGVNATFTNAGTLNGGVTFGATANALTGTATLTNNGVFAGPVTFNNVGTATLTNGGGATWVASGTSNMGTGASTLTNQLIYSVSTGGNRIGKIHVDGTVVFTNLETFNNAGYIFFGAGTEGATDGVANDRLVPNTNLNITEASNQAGIFDARLYMDFAVGGANQLSCAAAVTADCLDLRGYSVTGRDGAQLILNPVAGTGVEVATKIVLVDAAGGTLTATDFVLSEESVGYVTGANGRGIDGGLLTYVMVADEDADQLYLTAVGPGSFTASLLQLGQTPQAVWGLAADTIADRQQELRDTEGGANVWVRGVSSSVDSTGSPLIAGFSYDVGYDQETTGVMGGVDFGGEGWSAGVAAGNFDGEIRPTARSDLRELSGYGLGAYGAWSSGPLFANGLVNYVNVDLSSPLLGEDSEASAMGAQGEAGWRFQLTDHIAFEPLAALSWTNTDGMALTLDGGGEVATDELTSLNVGLGVRVVGEAPMGGLTARFAFLGRAWQPFGDDERTVTLGSGASAAEASYEDNEDVLGELGLTAGLHGFDDRLALTATGRLKMEEDYEDSQLLVGLRYRF